MSTRNDPATSLLFDVFALNQAVKRLLDAYMSRSPLSPAEYAFYSAIFETESITPSGLAARLAMPLTTIMDHLGRLETRGHVTRVRDTRDGRATRVVLTGQGLAAHRDANRSFEHAYARFARQLTVDEERVAVVLGLVRDAVEAATTEAAVRAEV